MCLYGMGRERLLFKCMHEVEEMHALEIQYIYRDVYIYVGHFPGLEREKEKERRRIEMISELGDLTDFFSWHACMHACRHRERELMNVFCSSHLRI